MSVQTVVIDVFQTNKKLKEFDKNVDRLGKSLEKMQKQMERLNQEKRSTGLSQGDTLMKSLDKMTSTMTRLFSNGIKLNNPTVTAKVTVDFSKMNLAGQMGVALKNADIAGMIIRNMPRSRMTMPEMKIDMPKSMKVEVTNEVKVKLPKYSPSDGKKSSNGQKEMGNFQDKIKKEWTNNKKIMDNWQNKAKKAMLGAQNMLKNSYKVYKPKTFDEVKGNIFLKSLYKKMGYEASSGIKDNAFKYDDEYRNYQRGKNKKLSRKQRKLNNNGVTEDLKSEGTKLGLGRRLSNLFSAEFTGYSAAIQAFAGTISFVANIIHRVIGVFQKIASAVSAIWGQVQKWAINPLVQTQNQISQNKGYKMLLGGEYKALAFDNSIFEMSEKSSFSHEALDSSARMFLSKGVTADETKRRLSLAQDTAAAFSLDDSGFQEITNGISQLSAKKNVYIEDVTQGFGNAIPTLKLITEGINKEAKGTKKSMDEIKAAIENGDYSGGELVEALLKGMETYGGTAEEIASTTYMGLQTKIKNMFQSNIVKNWGEGLSEGLTTGLSKFANWLDMNKIKFASWGAQLKILGKQIGEVVTNLLENVAKRMDDVFSSQKFQKTDLSGKIVIFWDKIIKEPFSNWWNCTGRGFFESAFRNIGSTAGGIISGIIRGFLGAEPEDALGEGVNLGIRFAQGFLEGFDVGGVFTSIVGALANLFLIKPLKWILDVPTTIIREIVDKNSSVITITDGEVTGVSTGQGAAGTGNGSQPVGTYWENDKGNWSVENLTDTSNEGNYVYWEDDKGNWTVEAAKASQNPAEKEKSRQLKSSIMMDRSKSQKENLKTLKEEDKYVKGLINKWNDLNYEVNSGATPMERMPEAQRELREVTEELIRIFPFLADGQDICYQKLKDYYELLKKVNFEEQRREINIIKMDLKGNEGTFEQTKTRYAQDEETINAYDASIGQLQGSSYEIMTKVAQMEEAKLNKENANMAGEDSSSFAAEEKRLEKEIRDDLAEQNISTFWKKISTESVNGMIQEKLNELEQGKQSLIGKHEEDLNFMNEYIGNQWEAFNFDVEDKFDKPFEDVYQMWKDNALEEEDSKWFAKELERLDKITGGIEDLSGKIVYVDIIMRINGKKLESTSPDPKEVVIDYGGENPYVTSSSASYADYGLVSPEGGSSDLENTFLEGREPIMEAKGDILMSPHLSWVAEAGPEAIIPLTGPYKNRGIDLWEKAGQMLGVTPKYAMGGIVGSYETPKEAPRLYRQIEESSEKSENEANPPARVDVGGINVSLSLGGFTFYGTEANSQEGIMKVIKAQMPDIADEIAGTIAVNIQRIFANMKLQTG